MASLVNKTKQITLCPHVEIATSLWERTKGLLGRKHLDRDRTLWIKPCSSIHTYFMQFAIDVVFVDQKLRVTRIKKEIQPWKLIFSPLKSDSVFEFPSGTISDGNIEIGDQLHVDH